MNAVAPRASLVLWIRGLAANVAIALVAVATIANPPAARAAGGVTSGTLTVTTITEAKLNTSTCQQVLFIGVRGSGETQQQQGGLGQPVNNAWNGFRTQAAATAFNTGNLRVGLYALEYPASGISLDMTTSAGRKAYAASIESGVTNLEYALSIRHRRCGGEKYVLAGYSQGAMVIHRLVLGALNPGFAPGTDAVAPALAGASVITIADGDHAPGDAYTDATGVTNHLSITAYSENPDSFTHADFNYSGTQYSMTKITDYARAQGNSGTLPSSKPFTVYNVCAPGDIICDTQPAVQRWVVSVALGEAVQSALVEAVTGVATHVTQYNSTSSSTYGSAVYTYGQRAATELLARVIPKLAITSPPVPWVEPDHDFTLQLSLSGKPVGATVRWTATNLPAGLNLDADSGLITGPAHGWPDGPATVVAQTRIGTQPIQVTTGTINFPNLGTWSDYPTTYDCVVGSVGSRLPSAFTVRLKSAVENGTHGSLLPPQQAVLEVSKVRSSLIGMIKSMYPQGIDQVDLTANVGFSVAGSGGSYMVNGSMPVDMLQGTTGKSFLMNGQSTPISVPPDVGRYGLYPTTLTVSGSIATFDPDTGEPIRVGFPQLTCTPTAAVNWLDLLNVT